MIWVGWISLRNRDFFRPNAKIFFPTQPAQKPTPPGSGELLVAKVWAEANRRLPLLLGWAKLNTWGSLNSLNIIGKFEVSNFWVGWVWSFLRWWKWRASDTRRVYFRKTPWGKRLNTSGLASNTWGRNGRNAAGTAGREAVPKRNGPTKLLGYIIEMCSAKFFKNLAVDSANLSESWMKWIRVISFQLFRYVNVCWTVEHHYQPTIGGENPQFSGGTHFARWLWLPNNHDDSVKWCQMYTIPHIICGWWFGTWILWLSIQLGMSSSQLTNSYFAVG